MDGWPLNFIFKATLIFCKIKKKKSDVTSKVWSCRAQHMIFDQTLRSMFPLWRQHDFWPDCTLLLLLQQPRAMLSANSWLFKIMFWEYCADLAAIYYKSSTVSPVIIVPPTLPITWHVRLVLISVRNISNLTF